MKELIDYIPLMNEIGVLLLALASFYIYVKLTLNNHNLRIKALETSDEKHAVDFTKLQESIMKWTEKMQEMKEGFIEMKSSVKHGTERFNETTKNIKEIIEMQERRMDEGEKRTELIMKEIREELKNKQDK